MAGGLTVQVVESKYILVSIKSESKLNVEPNITTKLDNKQNGSLFNGIQVRRKRATRRHFKPKQFNKNSYQKNLLGMVKVSNDYIDKNKSNDNSGIRDFNVTILLLCRSYFIGATLPI